MLDPDFAAPMQKFPEHPEDGGHAQPPSCSLAIVSLVFGIVGMTVLPVFGAIIAIVTGHLALGEIRDSGGRLGGRAAAKAGLILGYLWFVLASVVVATILFFFAARTHESVAIQTPATPAPFAAPGVRLGNEMDPAELQRLKGFGIKDDDEVICTSGDPLSPGPPDLAILTNRRIISVKGSRTTAFDLADVESVLDDPGYQRQYGPQNVFSDRYTIEITRKSGGRMRIMIRPASEGPVFHHALVDAWKAAGGKPAGDDEHEHR